jgi:hypothetical protein
MLSQSFINEILNSPSGTSWTNNGNGFTNNWGGMMDYDGGAQNYSSYSLAEQHNSIDGGGGVAGEIVLPPLHMTVPKSYQGNIALTMISFSMGFQQHLAKYLGHYPQFIDPLAGVRNDGPIQYIGGAGDVTGAFQIGGMILAANSDGNANHILAALMITRSGNTGGLKLLNVERGILAAEKNVISSGDYLRIENAASRINKPITVVGSRASGTAKAYSDWDYVIEGLNRKEWSKIKNSIPGARSTFDNTPRNIDIFKTLDLSRPYLTIYPR